MSSYVQALPVCSKEEWYHGEMDADQAERKLKTCGCNCYLVRTSKETLVLSLLHNGEVHHFNIEYGPSWYRLQASPSDEKFSKLTELVAHCRSNAITLTLGVACKAAADNKVGHHRVNKIYMEAKPGDLLKHSWYHDKMTKEEAEQVLHGYNEQKNCFLVRQSAKNNFVLSKKINGWFSHTAIINSVDGYCLEGRSDLFKSVLEMISHYSKCPIEGTQVLGIACDRESSCSHLAAADDNLDSIFEEKESHFSVSWRRCADLPVAISVPQVVRMGDHVYVGGGFRKEEIEDIFSYNLSKGVWTSLPYCPTSSHSLATFDGGLLVLGGLKGSSIVANVYTLANEMWKEILPPMPTPRMYLSAVSHGDRVIAAGGVVHIHSDGALTRTDVVEVYQGGQWFNTNRLSFPTSSFLMNIVGDQCYVLGGAGEAWEHQCTALHKTLSMLFENARLAAGNTNHFMPQVQTTWKKLQCRYPLPCPSNLVDIKGKLTTMGGKNYKSAKGCKLIGVYDPHKKAWVECKDAELPVALYRSCVVKLSEDEVMLVGGQPKQQTFSSEVFIGRFT